MITSYTTSELHALPIAEIKAIAITAGVDAAKVADRRRKADWIFEIELIEFVKVDAVPAAEMESAQVLPESESVPTQVTDFSEPTDIEQELFAELEALADAEQAAILLNDQEAARDYSDRYEATLAQYEAVINSAIDSLAFASIAICDAEPIRVHWESESVGTVSIDAGASVRVFRVIDLISTNPIIKVIASSGLEIDSRWTTAKNNRYIKAVREAIPSKLADMAEEACNYSLQCYSNSDGEEGERRGDGRGRVVSRADWPDERYLF